MKKLLNTLYVTNPCYFLGASGDNITLKENGKLIQRYPLHNLEEIVVFSHSGISAELLEKCTEFSIALSILNPYGRLNGRFIPPSEGNVLLRKKQIETVLDDAASLVISRTIIAAKIINSRNFLIRFRKQYKMRIDSDAFENVIDHLKESKDKVLQSTSKEGLRGIEGDAQSAYFGIFNQMILNNKETFAFEGRNRRPPLDPVNAMLSYAYTLLALNFAGALEAVGLDSYIGFLHTDRPGRISLALDLEEELRTMAVDRFVLRLINLKQMDHKDFIFQDSGAVIFTEDGRRKFLSEWQKQKYTELQHPFLQEKISWGLVPHIQALLLARFLRGDLDQYPPFFWK